MGKKVFVVLTPGANVIKLFTAVSYEFSYKLEPLSQPSLMFAGTATAGAYSLKHFSGAPLKGRLLALPSNIRLSWKGLPGKNALAYYE